VKEPTWSGAGGVALRLGVPRRVNRGELDARATTADVVLGSIQAVHTTTISLTVWQWVTAELDEPECVRCMLCVAAIVRLPL
jgi:hypothetical protein